ncbi:MAG: lipoprotein-releasing system ATP-binding protein LolD [Deltaproteobacteria bacterium]|nr:MAG: lipoprotein-releasing system ATP-binding protein LolD [Deltaproteobacteria bacterium]
MKKVLEVINIKKVIRDNEILKGISLSVEEGDFVSIIGVSGSGKSTLMYIMGLLDEPTEGEVFFEGVRVDFKNHRLLSEIRNRKIGFVFQFHYLIPELSAAENVMVPMLKTQKSRKDALKRAFSLLAELGLRGKENRKPYELSGGEQQRVAIARALANDPHIIMADEPTGNLDSKNTEIVMDIFLALNRMGRAILMVTHEIELARRTKKMVEMRDGVVVGIR